MGLSTALQSMHLCKTRSYVVDGINHGDMSENGNSGRLIVILIINTTTNKRVKRKEKKHAPPHQVQAEVSKEVK